MKKNTMEAEIKRAIGSGKLPMYQILDKVTVFAYRADYSKKVSAMADSGELVREWDETGLPLYSIKQ